MSCKSSCACRSKPSHHHDDPQCEFVFRCTSLLANDTMTTIPVVGVKPQVSSFSQIPATSVMFMAGNALVTLPVGDHCSSLVYTTCLCGKEVTVVHLFLRQPAVPAVSLETTPEFLLNTHVVNVQGGVKFTNCIENTGTTPLTNVVLTGSVSTPNPHLTINSLTLPGGLIPLIPSGYTNSPPLTLMPGQRVCWEITANITCTDVGIASFVNNVSISGTGLNTATGSFTALVNCVAPQ